MAPDPIRVPKALRPRYDEVTAWTDALCRKWPSPIVSGAARTWAAGVVSLPGRINVLTDRSTEPHRAMADLAACFGVGQSTMQAKVAAIQQAPGVDRLSAAWMPSSLIDRNPVVCFAMVNGLLVDLRTMPREVQEIALA